MTKARQIRNPIPHRSTNYDVDKLGRNVGEPPPRPAVGKGEHFNSRRDSMRKTLGLVAIAGLALTLAACGHNVEQRAATGAVTGAVLGGPVGAVAGAAVGTAVSKGVDPH
ncbi:hypothetical protein GALL_545800 [mine drainage metagenome]|uniref:Glycine zipper domain-containing protein n=1 Tax=mine drainage metagenome TaxID=410659 RepID=A0A1J5P8T0_9ZZZZ